MPKLNKVAIFKTGLQTSTNGDEINVTSEYLQDVVDSYSPSEHESPAVIGHPADNHPAYGWVKSLSVDKAKGILYANFKQVETNFAEMLKAGRFKKRSSSFYTPNHPNNPVKGKPYLRHVGFLGAKPPAVKGLADFSDNSTDYQTFEFSESDNSKTNEPKDNKPMPKDKTKPTTNADDQSQENQDFAEAQAKLDADQKAFKKQQADFAKKQKEFAKQQDELKKQDFSEFADGLIKTGQVPPAEKEALVSVLMELDGGEETFDFAEGTDVKTKSTVEVLQGMLGRLEKTIDFSECSGTDPNKANKPEHGFETDDDDDELHQKIQNYSEKHGIDYVEAVQQFDN